MDFKSLADRAREVFTKRGGAEAAKEDVSELKDVAGKDESLADKAKDAAEALKDPGAPGDTPTPPAAEPPAAEPPPAEPPAQP